MRSTQERQQSLQARDQIIGFVARPRWRLTEPPPRISLFRLDASSLHDRAPKLGF